MNAGKALTGIRLLEELSVKNTPVHARHPLAHLLITLGFILSAMSYDKYELSGMLPLLLYPVYVLAAGDLPVGAVLKRGLPALPFVLGVGLFNPLLDPNRILLAGHAVSAGWISLMSLVLRCLLTVTAALLLVAVCGPAGLSRALRALRVPKLIVSQLMMTLRYVHVLGAEAGRMALAYRLRAPGRQGVAFGHWGPFAGQWLLRSLARADRLHRAMLCRGYAGEMPGAARMPFRGADLAYLLAWGAYVAAARLIDVPRLLGALILSLGG